MVIPDAAVEAATKAFRETKFMDDALMNALEAAAPHMLAEAWELGMEAMYATTSSEWPPIPEANPYRTTK